jgi:hypothetical protein
MDPLRGLLWTNAWSTIPNSWTSPREKARTTGAINDNGSNCPFGHVDQINSITEPLSRSPQRTSRTHASCCVVHYLPSLVCCRVWNKLRRIVVYSIIIFYSVFNADNYIP